MVLLAGFSFLESAVLLPITALPPSALIFQAKEGLAVLAELQEEPQVPVSFVLLPLAEMGHPDQPEQQDLLALVLGKVVPQMEEALVLEETIMPPPLQQEVAAAELLVEVVAGELMEPQLLQALVVLVVVMVELPPTEVLAVLLARVERLVLLKETPT